VGEGDCSGPGKPKKKNRQGGSLLKKTCCKEIPTRGQKVCVRGSLQKKVRESRRKALAPEVGTGEKGPGERVFRKRCLRPERVRWGGEGGVWWGGGGVWGLGGGVGGNEKGLLPFPVGEREARVSTSGSAAKKKGRPRGIHGREKVDLARKKAPFSPPGPWERNDRPNKSKKKKKT